MAETYYALTDLIKLTDNLIAAMPSSYVSGILAVRNQIGGIPAADVRPVVHGNWLNPADCVCYQCSACGKYRNQEYGLNAPIFDKICPNCGAKMDGDGE